MNSIESSQVPNLPERTQSPRTSSEAGKLNILGNKLKNEEEDSKPLKSLSDAIQSGEVSKCKTFLESLKQRPTYLEPHDRYNPTSTKFHELLGFFPYNCPLVQACEKGDENICGYLMDEIFSATKDVEESLSDITREHGEVETVEQQKKDYYKIVNKHIGTALCKAIQQKNNGLVNLFFAKLNVLHEDTKRLIFQDLEVENFDFAQDVFQRACEFGNKDFCEEVLDQLKDLTSKDEKIIVKGENTGSETSLLSAVQFGKLENCKLILEKLSDDEKLDLLLKWGNEKIIVEGNQQLFLRESEITPLSVACESGKKDIVDYFLNELGKLVDDDKLTEIILKDKIVELNHQDRGSTRKAKQGLLFHAYKSGNIDLCSSLLDRLKDLNFTPTNCKNALYGNYNEYSKADREKPRDPIKIYFEEDGDGTKLDSHPKKALLGWLLENNCFHPQREYPKKIVDFAKKMLSEKTYELKFAKLLDRKVYYKGIVDFVDSSGLESLREFVGRDLAYKGSPIARACADGDLEMCKWLFKNGANINKGLDGETPLYIACKSGNIELCQWLVDNGATADISKANKYGRTPMHAACESGNLEVCQWLFEVGAKADISKTGDDKITPMQLACRKGHLKVCQWLFEVGAKADISKADESGYTPMFEACLTGQVDVCQWLFEVGAEADISKANVYGSTPMYVACKYGHLRVCQWLQKNGAAADISKANNDGYSPMHVACINGDLEMCKWLVNNGADINQKTKVNLLRGFEDQYESQAKVRKATKVQISPFLWACYSDKEELLQFLLDNEAKGSKKLKKKLKNIFKLEMNHHYQSCKDEFGELQRGNFKKQILRLYPKETKETLERAAKDGDTTIFNKYFNILPEILAESRIKKLTPKLKSKKI